MNLSDVIDIAVVGAGPCGLAVGVAAREAGLSCVLFDKGAVTSTLVGYPTHMTFFSTAERLEIGDVPFISVSPKPTRTEAIKYYRRVTDHFYLDVRQYHEVCRVRGEQGAFELTVRGREGELERVAARNVVVATGYFDTPRLLGVPGEETDKVLHYYHEGYPYFRQDCLVVGGGNSATDVALDLFRSGARVRLVHFADRMDKGVKPWVLPDLMNRVEAGDIEARWRTRVVEIRPHSVLLRDEETGETEEIPNDWVFAMTGFVPDPTLLRDLGVGIDRETGIPTHDRESMETNVPGVFLAGVVAAGYDANKIFIENGREHGARIVRRVLGGYGNERDSTPSERR